MIKKAYEQEIQVGVRNVFALNISRPIPNKSNIPLVFLAVTRKGAHPQYIPYDDLKAHYPHILFKFFESKLSINGNKLNLNVNCIQSPQTQTDQIAANKRSFAEMSANIDSADSIHLDSSPQQENNEDSEEWSDSEINIQAAREKAKKQGRRMKTEPVVEVKTKRYAQNLINTYKKIKIEQQDEERSFPKLTEQQPSGASVVVLHQEQRVIEYDQCMKQTYGQQFHHFISPVYFAWPHTLLTTLLKQKKPNFPLRMFVRGGKPFPLQPLPLPKTQPIKKIKHKKKKKPKK